MRAFRTLLLPGGFVVAALAASAQPGCVPDSFTYGSGGSSSSAGGGTPGVCGNGELDGDEECDLGLQNGDDHVDVSLEDSDLSRGCSSTCQHVVRWSAVVGGAAIDRLSTVYGIAASRDSVFVGGVVHTNPLDLPAVRQSGRRLYAELRPIDGEDVQVIVDRDLDAQGVEVDGNAIFAMRLGAQPNEVYALESVHQVGVRLVSYVRLRRSGATVWDSPAVAAPEYSYAALGEPDGLGRVLAVGPDFANKPVLHRVATDGQSTEVEDPVIPVGWAGAGPAAVAPVAGTGAVVAWQDYVARLGAEGQGVIFSIDLGAELGFELGVTGVCALGSSRYALSGWAAVNGGNDGVVVIVDDQLDVLDHDLFDGEAGGADGFTAIACDPDGSVVVVGEESTLENAAAEPLRRTHSRVLTRRYAVSAGGELLPRWTRTYQSPVVAQEATDAQNDGYAVTIDPDGFVYVGGRKQVSQTRSSAWVRKYAP